MAVAATKRGETESKKILPKKYQMNRDPGAQEPEAQGLRNLRKNLFCRF
jgi:hypothetical protein